MGGVPHFATIDSVSINDVPRPGEPGAPIPFCWGNDPNCVRRWCHTVAAHCPRLIVEVMRAVTTQLGRGCKDGSLAFSTRIYELVQEERSAARVSAPAAMTARQYTSRVLRMMVTYARASSEGESKMYFMKIMEEPLDGMMSQLSCYAGDLNAKVIQSPFSDHPIAELMGCFEFRKMMTTHCHEPMMRVPRHMNCNVDINNRTTFSLRVRFAADMVNVTRVCITRITDLANNAEMYQEMWDVMTQDEQDDFSSVWRAVVHSELQRFRFELQVQIEKGTNEFAKFQQEASFLAQAVKEFSRDIVRHEW